MKGKLMGGAVAVAIIVAATYGFSTWEASESQKQQQLCITAKQHLQNLEIQARALAVGLSVEDYAEAEKADASKLVNALDSASNEKEVDALIKSHSEAVEAKISATDAEVKSRGDQQFLEQRLKKQLIPVDVKQEILRAEKAVASSCE